MKNYTDYKEIVILTTVGSCIIKLLPTKEGYFFSESALKVCWKWIEGQVIDVSNLYDCLDSPDEIDFSYYEDIAESEEEQKIYKFLFHIVAYITKKISIIQEVNRPQYLDYIDNDYFEIFIKTITNEYECIKKIIEKTIKYCDIKMLENTDFYIRYEEVLKEVMV